MKELAFYAICGLGAALVVGIWVWALAKTKNKFQSRDEPEDWL